MFTLIRLVLWPIKLILKLALVAVVAYFVFSLFVRPSNDRDWNADQVVLPTATFAGDMVTIENVRNINYRSTTDYDVAHDTRTYDLSKLKRAWYLVEPLSGLQGLAHTLVSFEFEGGEYVSVSVEIRKEKGEKFSPIKGLLRQYELMYVVADERDVIRLRTNYRKDMVYLYPTLAIPEKARELFVSMLTRANKLALKPEFYNTLTSTCTTNIVTHINEVTPSRIPLSYKTLLPAYSDELAQVVGLIDASVPIEELRKKYYITEKAQAADQAPDFSKKIRE